MDLNTKIRARVSLRNSTMTNCSKPQYFSNANDFFHCYSEMLELNLALGIFGILLVFFTVVLNALVIAILARKQTKLNVFDHLMIAHCIVDGLTGLLNVPFVHIHSVMGYWPFGTIGSLLWASFDNGINFITNVHMLLITFIRFRSIKAPNTFEKEFLTRNSVIICASIWFIGYLMWTPISFYFGIVEYTTILNIRYFYVEFILIFFTWFMPMLLIVIFAVIIILILNKRRLRKFNLVEGWRLTTTSTKTIFVVPENDNSTTRTQTVEKQSFFKQLKVNFNKMFSLGPQVRFQIIILSYCAQWFPPCIITLIDPLCNCIPLNVNESVYWLTYTVCLTDPIVILVFNPNVGVFRNKQRAVR